MRRRDIIALISIVAVGQRASAQQGKRVARLGYLGPAPAASFAPRVDALRDGLRELGYVEGENLSIEFRWADTPQQMPQLAAELVRAGVDVIFAPSSTETAAALRVTRSVPVVFGAHADPVGVGHVAALAQPGGNATGPSMLLTDVATKEVEALKEALPNARLFGILFASTAPSHVPAISAAQTAARRLGLELRSVPVRSEEDLEPAFVKMVQDRCDGFIALATPLLFSRRALLAELALKHRLPSAFSIKENVVAGGLISYGPDARELTRRAATYIDRILKGQKAADLPVEQATRYELLINLKTAAALGLTIPPSLLARADEVIE
jgi:putative ABC transport system substrate-binding protein